MEEFAIALLCGDVRCDVSCCNGLLPSYVTNILQMYAGVFILDGNRARFSVPDWKTMLVIKTLRARLRDILTRSFKNPGKPLTTSQQTWMEIWQKVFVQDFGDK